MSELPKISCLLITAKDRFQYAQRSIRCYVDQTYPNRELLIVNEGPSEYQRQIQGYVDSLGRQDIHCIWLKGVYTLGGLRNISLAMATGQYFCQWDDDDFCMPHRLSTQYAYLSKHPKAKVCYLGDQLQYFFQSKELYWNNWKQFGSLGLLKHSLIPGTILSRLDVGVRYPNTRAGEDSIFADALIDKNPESVVLLAGEGGMHVYTHHGTNVYDIVHHQAIYQCRCCDREHMLKHRALICRALDYWSLDEVKVMSKEGLVFIHKKQNV